MKGIVFLGLLCLTCLGSLSACSTISKTAVGGAGSGYAKVYVYRDQVFGTNQYLSLSVNGREIGRTGPRTYFLLELPAGVHAFSSRQGEDDLVLQLAPSKTYFIRQQVFMGFEDINTLLYQANPEEAPKIIDQLRELRPLRYGIGMEKPAPTRRQQNVPKTGVVESSKPPQVPLQAPVVVESKPDRQPAKHHAVEDKAADTSSNKKANTVATEEPPQPPQSTSEATSTTTSDSDYSVIEIDAPDEQQALEAVSDRWNVNKEYVIPGKKQERFKHFE